MQYTIMRAVIPIVAICLILVAGCTPAPSSQYAYRQPEEYDDGIDVGTLDKVNLDSGSIRAAVDAIQSGKYGEIHSLLIYKDRKLVFEEYFPGHDYDWDGPNFHGAWVDWDWDTEHNIHSAGKSITSACVGIAIDQGYIDSVDQSIFDYLPGYQDLKTDGKDQITIEHMLTMTSGLEWDEWSTSYSNQDNDVIALWVDCDDPIACILDKPLVSEPGTGFTYSGGNMIVLGEIIKNATDMDIEAFAGKYLFAPMGVEPPEWRWIEGSDVVYAGGDQKLTPREMLKFGVTYLNAGTWNGQQIVSEGWVEHSSTPYPSPENSWFNSFLKSIPPGDDTWGRRGYSYTWWIHQFSQSGQEFLAFWAFGWGGQKIAVFPDQNAVVVFTGGNYTSADYTAKILTEFVLPAFE